MHQPNDVSVTAQPAAPAAAPRIDRVLGIDLARGLALFAMMATHIVPRVDEAGEATVVGLLQGRASALFAVLAGVSVVLATRAVLRVPGVRGWATAAVGLCARGLLIALIGLALGELPSGIAIILVNYGALFVIASLFLRLPTWLLGTTAWLWFLVTPQLSHVLRTIPSLGDVDLYVPSFSTLLLPDMWIGLFLSGYYPLLQWTGYILLGMWLARIDWSDVNRRTALLLGGIAAATLSLSASTLLLNLRGRWEIESLYGEERVTGAQSRLDEVLLTGAHGVTPADTPWWLVVAAPHSGTTFDLVQTAGIAMAVIAMCLLAGPALARGPVWLHAWLSRPGSTPLTCYTLHICVLGAAAVLPPMPTLDAIGWHTQWYAANVALVIVVAVLWTSLVSRRGPLESVLSLVVRAVQRPLLEGTGPRADAAGWTPVSGGTPPPQPPSARSPR